MKTVHGRGTMERDRWILPVTSRRFSTRMPLALDFGFELIACNLEIVILLHAEPELRRSAEITGQSKRGFARYAAPSFHDLCDAISGDMQLVSEPVHAHTEWPEEFFQQNFAWVNGRQVFLLGHRPNS